MRRLRVVAHARGAVLAFGRDRSAAAAVEFALVALPFLLLLLFVVQIAIYFMTKTSLDAGLIQTAEYMRQQFNTGQSPTVLDCNGIKTQITGSGGFINTTSLQVEIQPLQNISTATKPIIDCFNNQQQNTVLALRAQFNPQSFMPGFGTTLVIYSSALVRRGLQ